MSQGALSSVSDNRAEWRDADSMGAVNSSGLTAKPEKLERKMDRFEDYVYGL